MVAPPADGWTICELVGALAQLTRFMYIGYVEKKGQPIQLNTHQLTAVIRYVKLDFVNDETTASGK